MEFDYEYIGRNFLKGTPEISSLFCSAVHLKKSQFFGRKNAMDLESPSNRIIFVILMQFCCLITAIAGMICGAERAQWRGFLTFVAKLALAFVWLGIGTLFLLQFSFIHSAAGVAAYTAWGVSGIVPFVYPLVKAWKNKTRPDWWKNIWGIVTAGVFSGTLSLMLYHESVVNGIFSGLKFLRDESLNELCFYLLVPAVLFYTPVFGISALILGAIRKKFSGFVKNLGLLAAAPIGLIAVMGTGLYYGARGVHGEVGNYASILLVFFSWILCLWLPYGFMAWRGHRKKDELRFCNGLAGLGAVNFFMIGLFLLGYIGRGV